MQNFHINTDGYTMPEAEPKWSYNIGSTVLWVDYDDEPAMQLQVRTA